MTFEDYLGDWMKVIDVNELNTVINTLNRLYRISPICPIQSNVFKAFTSCSFNELKVIMLGQDPYPQKDIATGILFGNSNSIAEGNLSPSLKIVKEACINLEIPRNGVIFDNSLESWANQGILMINSALTVEMNKIGSHAMLWRPFIAKLLKNLSEINSGLIYVLFGKQAQTFKPYINKNSNYIFEYNHPAYYARTGEKFECDVFDKINKILKENNGTTIEWFKEY